MTSSFFHWLLNLITGKGKKRDKILSLDELLHTPPEAEMHRAIYTEMMIPWGEEHDDCCWDAGIYNHLFEAAQRVYNRIVADSHPELNWEHHFENIEDLVCLKGEEDAAIIIVFVVYIYLKVRPHDKWEVNLLVENLTGKLREAVEDDDYGDQERHALFMKAEQIIAETLKKRSEEPAPKAIVEVPQEVRTEAPQAVITEEAEEEPGEEGTNGQLTNSQLVLLFQSILNLNLLATNRNALSRLIAAVSGRSADSIRQHTKREINYDSEKVKQDVEVVANLLNELAPAIARRMRNDIADPPIQDPPQ